MAQQQVWAALEVALRVPCLYIIDAIFNSYYDSSQSGLCIVLQIFLRLLGKDSGDSPWGQGVPCPGRTGAAGHLVVRGSGNYTVRLLRRASWRGAGTQDARASVDSGVVVARQCSIGIWRR